jgi:curli biogenesis system outer membrane secretion channel CsgG
MKSRIFLTIAGLALLACCGIAAAHSQDENAGTDALKALSAHCNGPKKRLAVLKAGATAKYGSLEGADAGEAIASQLATVLEATQCFVLADRLALADVLREQEMGAAGLTTHETAARPGAMIGAQILVKAEITEFEPGKQSNGATVGFGFANIPLGLQLGGNRNVAHMALDVRLIEASTGQVLASQRVDSQAKSFGMLFGVDISKASVSTDNYSKTPLGIAMRAAVTEAAGYIIKQASEISWVGQIVDVQGSSFYVNAGANAGLKVGDSLKVSTVARELIDPATGISIGRIEQPLGEARIEHVEEQYAIASIAGSYQPRRGDLLRM